MQSLSALQVVKQLVPAVLQMNGAQLTVLAWLQVPLPVQNEGGW
jgi:hypothetical protein